MDRGHKSSQYRLMSVLNIATFMVSVLAQLGAILLLPRTAGFTQLGPAVLCCLLFSLGGAALARLAHSGVELGILVPLMATIIPLATITIGIVAFGESASPLKLTLLGAACMLIGVAATRA